MRRSLLVILMLLLACSYATAADYLRLDKDDIYENATQDFSVYILRECPTPAMIMGTSNGIVVTATGSATWTFNSFTPDPAASAWFNLGGLLFSRAEQAGPPYVPPSMDNTSPDTFLTGGAAMPPGGMPVVMTEHKYYDLNLTMGDLAVGETGEICFDSAFVFSAGSWKFSGLTCGQGGAPDRPLFLGGSAGADVHPWCVEVKQLVCIPPTIDVTPIGNLVEVNICGTASFQFHALPGMDGLNPATITGWSVITGIGSIDNNGMYTASVAPDACGDYPVTIQVDNSCTPSMSDTYQFTVRFVNHDPYFTTCPDNCTTGMTPVGMGNSLNFTLGVDDPDPCQGLTMYQCGIAVLTPFPHDVFHGTATVAGNILTVTTTPADGDVDICVTVCVEDDQGATATCEVGVDILSNEPFEIKIEKLHDVYQGHYAYVPINLYKGSEVFAGFDFLVGYDVSALIFMEAELGSWLDGKWEYFTYRYNWNGNCGGSCPSGLLRVVGIADINNGPYHPPDASLRLGPVPSELVVLTFYVTNDRTFGCMYVPIRFFWDDCGDNTMSSKFGDSLFLSRFVYDFEMNDITGVLHYGGHWWLPGGCDNPDPTKPDGIPFIDFIHGGIDIICPDSIDATGDLNLNNIANEVADAVLYTNYFIYGLGVFNINPEGQIAASDVNNDGRVLTVGDLVYLVRLLTGDELAFPKLSPYANTVEIAYGNVVSSNSAVDIGAALFVFDGSADVELLADGMKLKSDIVEGQTRVLVWSDATDHIPSGNSDIFAVNGDVNLVEVSVSDYYGNMMNVNTTEKVLPTSYALLQNYPNPFNPSTDITIVLPEASQYKLDIYNVAGQLVESFSGYGVNEVTVTWDATGVASGIYFYKATAGQFTATKKMVLMK